MNSGSCSLVLPGLLDFLIILVKHERMLPEMAEVLKIKEVDLNKAQ